MELPNVNHAILYVREAHPGSHIPPHQSVDDKRAWAQLLRDDDGESRLILIDRLDGAAHKAYGSLPNSLYIINSEGVVVYRSKWNNARATWRAVGALLEGKTADPEGYFTPAYPPVLLKTLKRSGTRAITEFVVALPKLIWGHLIKKNVQLFFSKRSK